MAAVKLVFPAGKTRRSAGCRRWSAVDRRRNSGAPGPYAVPSTRGIFGARSNRFRRTGGANTTTLTTGHRLFSLLSPREPRAVPSTHAFRATRLARIRQVGASVGPGTLAHLWPTHMACRPVCRNDRRNTPRCYTLARPKVARGENSQGRTRISPLHCYALTLLSGHTTVPEIYTAPSSDAAEIEVEAALRSGQPSQAPVSGMRRRQRAFPPSHVRTREESAAGPC